MKNKYKAIVFFLILGIFLLGAMQFVLAADETPVKCTVAGGCTEQGLRLATLLQNQKISLPLIVGAALIDSINPCAIGMLILLLGYLMVFNKQPEKMFKTGTVYIVTIFVTYFLVGLVFSQFVYLLLAWQYYAVVSQIIKYGVIILIWAAALVNLKDVFWYDKGFSLHVPHSKVPLLVKLIQKVSIPATIVLGILVTLFELPCSLPLYVGAIMVMTSSFSYLVVVGYLLLYNLIFVLPLIVIFTILLKTKKVFEAKDIQERGNRWMKLSMSLAQIGIGIVLWFL
jgi:cytochrome c biogenesis protein CcdA